MSKKSEQIAELRMELALRDSYVHELRERLRESESQAEDFTYLHEEVQEVLGDSSASDDLTSSVRDLCDHVIDLRQAVTALSCLVSRGNF